MGITQVSADSIDFDNEQLDQEFEKVLESIPDGEYISDDKPDFGILATKDQYKPKAGDILYTPIKLKQK